VPVSLNLDDLTAGVIAGALGLAPALLFAGPGAGVPIALAAGVVLLLGDLAPLLLVAGLAVLALPTLVLPAGPRSRGRVVLTAGAVVLGTVMVVAGLPTEGDGPLRAVSGLVLLVASTGLVASSGPVVLPPRQTPLVGVAAAGVVLAVPDTESALTVFGAAAVAAGSGLVPRLRDRHPVALTPLVALVVWSVVAGSAGRDVALIGGLACLGVLLADPAARALLALTGGNRRVPPALLLVGVQIVVAGFASRLVTRSSGVAEALLLAGVVLAVAAAVLAFARDRARADGRPGPDADTVQHRGARSEEDPFGEVTVRPDDGPGAQRAVVVHDRSRAHEGVAVEVDMDAEPGAGTHA
jgi:hypothetical protein